MPSLWRKKKGYNVEKADDSGQRGSWHGTKTVVDRQVEEDDVLSAAKSRYSPISLWNCASNNNLQILK